MTMLTEHVLTETDGRSEEAVEPLMRMASDLPPLEINPVDPRLPPDAPMAMATQILHPEGEGFVAWLRGFFPPSGQAG